MPKAKKIVIFDGHALLHRAFHALPYMNTKAGIQTNAVYGFTMMMLLALKQLKPDYVVVAWDAPGKTFRHDQYTDYKATRAKTAEELKAQMPITKDVIKAFNIPLIEKAGFEADDIIGTLADKYGVNHKVVIVTGDKDELQLVDNNVSVFTMRRGLTDTVEYTPPLVKEKYGVAPDEFVIYKALKGDASDNIPGVTGIGDKTAADLVSKYHSLDNIYAHLDELKPALRSKLERGKINAYLSLRLSKIKKNVELRFNLQDAVIHDYDRKKVFDLFHKLEFKSLLNKIPMQELTGKIKLNELEKIHKTAEFNRDHLKNVKYHLITKKSDLQKLANELKKQSVFAFDTETDSEDQIDANLIGVSFCFKEAEAYYVPLRHNEKTEIDYEEFIDIIGPVLLDPKIGKVGHNIKYDYVVLRPFENIKLGPIIFDTMVAAFLINPISRAQSLTQLAYNELGISMIEIEEVIGPKGKDQKTFDAVAIKDAMQYAAEDADITWRLYKKLSSELSNIGKLNELAKKLEWPLIPVLGDMEFTGIKLDLEFLGKLSSQYEKRISKIQRAIWKHTGKKFNISSTQQLKKVLFEELKINTTGLKKTKTGISTAASELEKLRGVHPVIDLMFEYRELTKLKSTYVDALPGLIKPDGRIHTSFNQTIAQTGRLSSTNPNLQNIPIRTELGREIRKAFIADTGKIFVSADYSQIELRLAAELASDEPMIKDFKSGADIHTLTAAEMFNVGPENVTTDMRYAAKTINFGVLYGMNPHGLSLATGFDREKAKQFIDRYFELRKGVADYIAKLKKMAHKVGYTETLFGRRRPCPDVKSSNFIIRSAAERAAVNMPLQGTAADMMKLAMIEIYKKLPKGADLILQIHDELIIECYEEQAKEVASIMQDTMTNIVKFEVPIEVSVRIGKNWGELE